MTWDSEFKFAFREDYKNDFVADTLTSEKTKNKCSDGHTNVLPETSIEIEETKDNS